MKCMTVLHVLVLQALSVEGCIHHRLTTYHTTLHLLMCCRSRMQLDWEAMKAQLDEAHAQHAALDARFQTAKDENMQLRAQCREVGGLGGQASACQVPHVVSCCRHLNSKHVLQHLIQQTRLAAQQQVCVTADLHRELPSKNSGRQACASAPKHHATVTEP